jgi:mRNA interferase HigB
MRVIYTKRLRKPLKRHADARGPLQAWHNETLNAVWRTPEDVKSRFPSVSFTSRGNTIFNIKGNKYRLAATIAYKTGIVYVEWFGTHAEYSRKKL